MTLRACGRWRGALGRSKDFQIEFFIELRHFAFGRGAEQFGAHGGEDAVVAGGVVTQCLAQLRCHECSIAGGGEQMIEAGGELFATGVLHGEASADATAERQ